MVISRERNGVDLSAPEARESRWVNLSPSLGALLPSVVNVTDAEGRGIRLVLDLVDEGIRPVRVTVTAADGSFVDGTALRAVRIGEAFERAVANTIHFEPEADEDSSWEDAGPKGLNPISASLMAKVEGDSDEQVREVGGSSDEWLQRVAHLHKAATFAGIPPQKFIIDGLGVPRSTAGYWIAKARARGYLAPPAPRQRP